MVTQKQEISEKLKKSEILQAYHELLGQKTPDRQEEKRKTEEQELVFRGYFTEHEKTKEVKPN